MIPAPVQSFDSQGSAAGSRPANHHSAQPDASRLAARRQNYALLIQFISSSSITGLP